MVWLEVLEAFPPLWVMSGSGLCLHPNSGQWLAYLLETKYVFLWFCPHKGISCLRRATEISGWKALPRSWFRGAGCAGIRTTWHDAAGVRLDVPEPWDSQKGHGTLSGGAIPPCHGEHIAETATSQSNLPGRKPSLAWDGGTPNKMLGGRRRRRRSPGSPTKATSGAGSGGLLWTVCGPRES